MRFIGNMIEKLQRHPKRIVFPEGTEPRVLQAARQFYSLRLGAPILLGLWWAATVGRPTVALDGDSRASEGVAPSEVVAANAA